MRENKSLNIKRLLERTENIYRDSDLFSLLADGAYTSYISIEKRIKYKSFFKRVKAAVSLEIPPSAREIGEILSKDGEPSFRELSLFFDYAKIVLLTELDIPYRSDKLLCDTVEYLKKLEEIECDELYLYSSDAERILSESIYFKGADETTKNTLRNKVSRYARKFSISEKEAAAIILSSDPFKKKASLASYLYLPAIWSITLILFLLSAYLLNGRIHIALLLLLPLSELSKQICDTFFSRTVRSDPIPKLKLKELPDEGKTLCVITTLITSEKDASELSEKIKACYFSNRGKNASFGLLCDLKESDTAVSPLDKPITDALKDEINMINEKYGSDIFLFTRPRRFSETEGKFFGKERKRGAVIELTRFLRSKESTIELLVGDPKKLSGTKYVITLDSDTRLYNGAVRDLVGAMLYPSNKPKVEGKTVTEGYGIMQPRMEASLISAEKTPFAVLSSGNGGTDIYASAAYEAYQSIFGEGIFCGKGIFDVDVFQELIDGAFPNESVLSHDLLEGSRLRAGAITDISLTDDLPKNPLSCFDRSHRWIRGDIQALMFAGKKLENANRETVINPINRLSKYKLWDNLRRALVPVSASLAVILAVFLPQRLSKLTLFLAVLYLIYPCIPTTLTILKNSGRRFFSHALPETAQAVASLIYGISSLLYTGYISLDAVMRAGFRVLFSRKHLLEWKTASETEKGIKGLPLYIYKMLPSMLVGGAIAFFAPLPVLKFVGIMFFVFPFAAFLIGKEFKASYPITKQQKQKLTEYASDMWHFFSDKTGAYDNYLPPDNFQLSPTEKTAHRTSPTNIGLYLLSCVSAFDFGFINSSELISRVISTLDTVEKLQKKNGHLYNWYDTKSLEILGTPYISTVDSGNFTACLIALQYALSELESGSIRVSELCKRIEAMISKTDFSWLYDKKRKLFRIGINTAEEEQNGGHYDFFMSEARTASYLAIARGQVEREHWGRLSRPLISREGFIGLASWGGTMFEYMMPALILPTRFGSLSYEALSFASREQKKDKINGAWGISESGYFAFDADMNYQYKAFGAPALGLKRGLEKESVISPYSSFLTLPFSLNSAIRNLSELEKLGMYGHYGFYEALDMTPSRVGKGRAVIKSYMSHHMGMSLIACANACFDGIFVKRFMKSPEMSSSSELLEEKVPVNSPALKRNTKAHVELKNVHSRYEGIDTENPKILRTEASPYAAMISENGLSVTARRDMLKFSASGIDISADPFIFGDIHRTRLLFSADGEIYDILSRGPSRGSSQGRLCFALDERHLMAEASVSISGKHRAFVISLEAMGHFDKICPLFCFEPCLSSAEEKLSHPAYSDIMISSEYLEAEGVLFYFKKDKKSSENDIYTAVSFEGSNAPECHHNTRGILGNMYQDDYPKKLFTASLSPVNGAVIEPFCLLRHESVSKGGKYIGNIIITVGKSKKEVLSHILEIRKELKFFEKKNLAKHFSVSLAKTASERLAVCSLPQGFTKTAELMLTSIASKRSQTQYLVPQPISSLWCHGISGDLPIFTIKIDDILISGGPASRIAGGFIAAHKYLALSGVKSDLVFICKRTGDYSGGAASALKELCEEAGCSFMIGHSGGIFIVEEDIPALKAASLIYASANRETTVELLIAKHLPKLPLRDKIVITPSQYLEPAKNENNLSVHGGSFSESGFSVYKGSQRAPWSYVYALGHFGTLVTQNSLGYSWIGNCQQRRITPFYGDTLLDFSGERLILKKDGELYDLCAVASKTEFNRGCAEYHGSIESTDYKVKVTVGVKLPCKLITVSIGDNEELQYRVDPVIGEKKRQSRPIAVSERDGIRFFTPLITDNDGFDTGFLIEKRFAGKRVFILGAYPNGGEKVITEILLKYKTEDDIEAAEKEYSEHIETLLPKFNLLSREKGLSEAVSYYLPYQTLVCRFFGRTGFYQSGGAYGFRDQLQDCLTIMRGDPVTAKRHIFRSAFHQYEEGDVMHWWHTVRGKTKGVRTRYSDDLLWLPYVTAEYIEFTGENEILDTVIKYQASPVLGEDETDRYEEPQKSKFRESLYLHCMRAIDRSLEFGKHGLPLMKGGDWNDGMNNVGASGGESVWLGMFLILVLEKFIPLMSERGDISYASKYREAITELRSACEKAFSENRYLRAYYKDGTPLGKGASIDLLPQAFAAIIGLDRDKTKLALKTALERLFDKENRILKLLSPPYGKNEAHDAGYIAAYPPGIRENGGQYTHAAAWAIIGCTLSGMEREAFDIIKTILPASICENAASAVKYRGEPYFLAGDVSSNPACAGQCGWSLYTGAAGWFYLAVTEYLLGFSFSSDSFSVSPKLSPLFTEFTVRFSHNDTDFTVKAALGNENKFLLDGKIVNNLFYFDKKSHLIEITVEKKSEMR